MPWSGAWGGCPTTSKGPAKRLSSKRGQARAPPKSRGQDYRPIMLGARGVGECWDGVGERAQKAENMVVRSEEKESPAQL